MKEKIVIIGAGEIGRAIEKVLSVKDLDVQIWDKDESKVAGQKPLAKIIPEADIVFLCVPSWAMRQAATETKPFLNKNTVIISLAKGLEESSKKTAYEILEEVLTKDMQIAILSGPMLAEELIQGKFAMGVVASKNIETFKKIEELFEGENPTSLHVEYSSDIRGVAFCGVLKNIYAVALGIADGLGLGSDVKGWLVSESIKEMQEIIRILGGKPETALGPAGVGDLITTGFSNYSSNHQIGGELVKTGKYSKKSEGFVSLPSIIDLLDKSIKKFKLLNALNVSILQGKDIKKVFENIIKEI